MEKKRLRMYILCGVGAVLLLLMVWIAYSRMYRDPNMMYLRFLSETIPLKQIFLCTKMNALEFS